MKKLNKYLSLSAAVLGSSALNAGIVYTDVNPDELLNTDGDIYDIDFNSSGGYDFRVLFSSSQSSSTSSSYTYYFASFNARLEAQSNNSMATVSGYGSFYNLLEAYNLNDNINSSLNWNSDNQALFGNKFISSSSSSSYSYSTSSSNGIWAGLSDKYVAVKFRDGGNIYYGWARFDVGPNYDYVLLKDFAYESTPSTPILAGSSTNASSIASNIVSSDIADNRNGLDLAVTFDKAPIETGIKEYRVIAVKSNLSSNFNLQDANSSFSYATTIPNGSNQTTIFNASSKDSDGDLIVENIAYNVFILSVPDLINSTISNLSDASNEVTLTSLDGKQESLFSSIHITINNKHISISSKDNIDNVIITDLSGKQVFNDNTIKNINLEHVTSGVYILTLKVGNQIETKKIAL